MQDDHKRTTVWQIPHRRSDTRHSTQKPIECMRRPILHHTLQGDAVYDPFLGSGTTIIAAEMTGRRCFGIELSPEYRGLVIARWEQLTGKKAPAGFEAWVDVTPKLTSGGHAGSRASYR
jgi:DNA modification methylase